MYVIVYCMIIHDTLPADSAKESHQTLELNQNLELLINIRPSFHSYLSFDGKLLIKEYLNLHQHQFSCSLNSLS